MKSDCQTSTKKYRIRIFIGDFQVNLGEPKKEGFVIARTVQEAYKECGYFEDKNELNPLSWKVLEFEDTSETLVAILDLGSRLVVTGIIDLYEG